MFFSCTNDYCSSKYTANAPLEACPKCRSPVAAGIDFIDMLNHTYETIEELTARLPNILQQVTSLHKAVSK